MSLRDLRLRVHQEVQALDAQLIDHDVASSATELDLTNCMLTDPDELYRRISSLSKLRSLSCVACMLRPCDLLILMLTKLPSLMELEFSIVGETGVAWQIDSMQEIASLNPGTAARNLRFVYVEIGGNENFELLRGLLHHCPNLTTLHVHFVRGIFCDALTQYCCILAGRSRLNAFAFTSELTPTSVEYRPTGPLEFSSYANFCANVAYQRYSDSWSCVRLGDMANDWASGRNLPSQLVVVTTDDEDLMAGWIYLACFRHVWSFVHQLCLLKLPSTNGQTAASARCRDSLRHFFSTVRNIVELNVSSFHFGPDLDLTELLQRDALRFLQALSASPCGLRHPHALQRLADKRPGIEDLDLRVDRRGGLVRCSVCETEFCLEAEQMQSFRDAGKHSHYRRKLARLTICDVPKLASLLFLEACSVDTVRLCNCPGTLLPDCVRLGQLLAKNGALRFLLLRDDALPLGETSLLASLSLIASLEYLCLLSAKPVSHNVACTFVLELAAKLSQLKCLHVHYRVTDDGAEQRVTWVRREALRAVAMPVLS
ncbi:uncharacterized protein [Dermacentor andersoni]|uniref:uncharacterized protein n=1 Tax=Dermacentor andersoni TaxID=34620 RepID=UPI003B3ADCBD